MDSSEIPTLSCLLILTDSWKRWKINMCISDCQSSMKHSHTQRFNCFCDREQSLRFICIYIYIVTMQSGSFFIFFIIHQLLPVIVCSLCLHIYTEKLQNKHGVNLTTGKTMSTTSVFSKELTTTDYIFLKS